MDALKYFQAETQNSSDKGGGYLLLLLREGVLALVRNLHHIVQTINTLPTATAEGGQQMDGDRQERMQILKEILEL